MLQEQGVYNLRDFRAADLQNAGFLMMQLVSK